MPLPDSYTLKPNSVPAYFDAIMDAQPPERFSLKFLENLGFTSTNDRLFIGILKDLKFLNRDGVPQPRYFEFLDRSRSKQVLAQAIRDTFSDLFAINIRANELSVEDTKNKLRTLYAGKKTDLVINHIAKTFNALCEFADFETPLASVEAGRSEGGPAPVAAAHQVENIGKIEASVADKSEEQGAIQHADKSSDNLRRLTVSGLQYHINIVLPDTRDQAVYDAIFKSLREHLG